MSEDELTNPNPGISEAEMREIETRWRLDQVRVRLHEVEIHLRKLRKCAPDHLQTRIHTLAGKVGSAHNRASNIAVAESARKRREAGMFNKNEVIAWEEGRDPKPGQVYTDEHPEARSGEVERASAEMFDGDGSPPHVPLHPPKKAQILGVYSEHYLPEGYPKGEYVIPLQTLPAPLASKSKYAGGEFPPGYGHDGYRCAICNKSHGNGGYDCDDEKLLEALIMVNSASSFPPTPWWKFCPEDHLEPCPYCSWLYSTASVPLPGPSGCPKCHGTKKRHKKNTGCKGTPL